MIDPGIIHDVVVALGIISPVVTGVIAHRVKRRQTGIETKVNKNEARLTDHDTAIDDNTQDMRPLIQLVIALEKDSRECNDRVAQMNTRLNIRDPAFAPDESEVRLRRDLAQILERRVSQREASEQS